MWLYCIVTQNHHDFKKATQDTCTIDAVIKVEDRWPSMLSLPELLSDLFTECLATLTGQFSQSGGIYLAPRDSLRWGAERSQNLSKHTPHSLLQVAEFQLDTGVPHNLKVERY